MKKINAILAAIAAVSAFASCNKVTTEGVSWTTTYAVIELDGGTFVSMDKGSAYVDPGYTAMIGTEDVSAKVQVTSNVDMNKSGLYQVVYSITNDEGFTATATRTVAVFDKNDPYEGAYYTSPSSYRLTAAGAKTSYGKSFRIIVLKVSAGVYKFDDFLGGYYCQRAGYGTNYAMSALVGIAADGTMTLQSSSVPGWGDEADGLDSGKFENGTFTWSVGYAGMSFNVTMSK